jgi:hypothetical protein
VTEGTSILGQMAAGIVARKEETAKGRLTLTGEEKAATPGTPAIIPMIAVAFPNDHPTEVIVSVIRDLERQRAIIDSLIEDMRKSVKMEAPAPVALGADQAERERFADERAKSNAAKVEVMSMAGLAEEAVAGMEQSKAFLMEMAALQSADPAAFKVRMDALKANAQAHAFTQPAEVPGTALPNMAPADDTVTSGAAEVSVAAGGWTCPEHGSFVDAVSKKGRRYRKCPAAGCKMFELP